MRVFYILSIILFTAFQAKSQAHSSQDPSVRIIRFYPNPASSQITFDLEQGYDNSYSFQIFNFVGKKVYDNQNVTPRTVVNVADYYRGVYIFQLKDKTGKIVDSGKFQVAH